MGSTILLRRLIVLCAIVAMPAARIAAQPAPNDATQQTTAANNALLQSLPFKDRQDYDDAARGFVASMPEVTILGPDGKPVWSLTPYDFLKAEQAPPSVNPSLWRMAQLNMLNGLFKVTDGIYQIRGFDLSNMTIVEGKGGLVVIDPLISPETAKAGMDLYFQHRPKKPVAAVVYTHSHVDHYGGVKGVVSQADVKAGKVKIIAPEGFLEEAVKENVFAGNAMSRRAIYMYGALLPKNEKGQVDGGLGKTTSIGTPGLIAPTDTIKKTGETRTVGGVQMVFQMAPGTEAPAEFLIYFPQMKALDTAEDATHTLHNLYTLRGAQVRDANKWWKTLDETIALFGGKTDVVFAQHHWPKWGQAQIVPYLEKQRDLYKYIHDQSLRLANQGYTMIEIAEQLELPPSLAQEWAARGYYGTVNHDAKAVYQRYLGWYDGNPANLYALPPEEAGKRYVEFMGGAPAVIQKARDSYAKGDYRWVAEVMKQVVFADPNNQEARNLEADALEQLGYQAESGPWRNVFLMGAYELRNGVPKALGAQTASPDTIAAMTNEMLIDYMGVQLNGPKAAGKTITLNWTQPDTKATFVLKVDNAVLHYKQGAPDPKADATLTMPRERYNAILLGTTTLDAETKAGHAKVTGNAAQLTEFLGMLDTFNPMFNVVTP
jgi:alkyl sulfatase BDS1-like metallo-beta-lactamase superfamily hydrolase